MNQMKDKQLHPKCQEFCNILSSLLKKKGSRNNFDSYRGIYRFTIFRGILDKPVYNDEYSNIDKNLTDANVGARKRRNLLYDIFVLNIHILNSNYSFGKNCLLCFIVYYIMDFT